MRAGSLTAGCALAAAACTGQESRPSTPQDRAEIERRVRACGFPMRNVRWIRSEALDRWELGFDTDPSEMIPGSAKSACVSRVGDDLISRRRLDVSIAYAGIEGESR